MPLSIRPLTFDDFPSWLPVWTENNQGQNDEAVTAQTWQKLTDPTQPIYGFAAFDGKKLVGILHYVLHPTTGSIHNACYMQDLFTLPKYRGQGVAKELLKELEKTYKRENWARIYWVAEANNEAAQALYKKFGAKLDFTFHVFL